MSLDLTKLDWTLSNTSKTIQVEKVRFPGDVFGHLLKAGVLDQDPHYGRNDIRFRWVSQQSWTYGTSFNLDLSMLEVGCRLIWYCESLDTAATLLVNGVQVGYVTNQFHAHHTDISSQFPDIQRRKGLVQLSIQFESMSAFAKCKHDQYPYEVPDEFKVAVAQGEPHRNFARKVQCHFGWDWGPCFLPVGASGAMNLFIISPECPFITQVGLRTSFFGVSWRIDYGFDSDLDLDLKCTLMLMDSCRQVLKSETSVTRSCAGFMLVPDNMVRRWWPRGYGEPTTYVALLEITHEGKVLFKTEKRVGFKTAELIDKLDEDGKGSCFYFIVNEQPVFCKGTNVIPQDIFEHRITDQRFREMLHSCADANMNMVRVWGGGQYERESFYQTCDELGLMVWQEFMFACAPYPVDVEFLDSVKHEVEYQMKRLMNHPSILLWSGNNENLEAILGGWYEDLRKDPYVYVVDHHVLFHETIAPTVRRIDPCAIFLSTSPSNGVVSDRPYRLRYKVPNNPWRYGDTHYYNYKDDGSDPLKMLDCRFVSEYGWQSFPDSENFLAICSRSDMSPLSEFVVQRNHHRNGQMELDQHIKMHFDLEWLNKQPFDPAYFKNYCLITQVLQAHYIKAQTEHYRRLMGRSHYYCMGALFWQCNDVWLAPTWSALQYGGDWKLLQNYAKEFFKDVLISGLENKASDSFEIWITSDAADLTDLDVHVELWSLSINKSTKTHVTRDVKCGRCQSVKVAHVSDFNSWLGSRRDVLVVSRLLHNSEEISSNVFFPNSYKLSIQRPVLNLAFDSRSSDTIRFKITSNRISPVTVLRIRSKQIRGRFHPNGMLLLPEHEHVVEFRCFELDGSIEDSVDVSNLGNAVEIVTLYDLVSGEFN